jgi:hypothetical protein
MIAVFKVITALLWLMLAYTAIRLLQAAAQGTFHQL